MQTLPSTKTVLELALGGAETGDALLARRPYIDLALRGLGIIDALASSTLVTKVDEFAKLVIGVIDSVYLGLTGETTVDAAHVELDRAITTSGIAANDDRAAAALAAKFPTHG